MHFALALLLCILHKVSKPNCSAGRYTVKVNLAGLLRQAAACIDPERDTGAYAYMLGEVADHAEQTRAGEHTVDEFALHYCLTEQVTA